METLSVWILWQIHDTTGCLTARHDTKIVTSIWILLRRKYKQACHDWRSINEILQTIVIGQEPKRNWSLWKYIQACHYSCSSNEILQTIVIGQEPKRNWSLWKYIQACHYSCSSNEILQTIVIGQESKRNWSLINLTQIFFHRFLTHILTLDRLLSYTDS